MQQLVSINATVPLKLTYDGFDTIDLLYNASALQIQNALTQVFADHFPSLAGVVITVAKNSNQFTVTFHDFGAHTIDQLVASGVDLLPVVPDDLTNLTIEITSGPAKNKVRIIKDAIQISPGVWKAELDHLWESPFDHNTETPASDSTYTLYVTNPNLLVDEKTSTDILWVYDDDNPASFNDAAYVAAHPGQDNPFAVGSLSYETSDAYDHTALVTGQPLDQFRIQGFGMGADRTIARAPTAPRSSRAALRSRTSRISSSPSAPGTTSSRSTTRRPAQGSRSTRAAATTSSTSTRSRVTRRSTSARATTSSMSTRRQRRSPRSTGS